MVVVVVVTPVISSEVVTIPTESDVETPLRVDAASTTTGVSVVDSVVLPVGVSVTTTTLVTAEPEIVATVPTPEVVCFAVVVVDSYQNILSVPMQLKDQWWSQ